MEALIKDLKVALQGKLPGLKAHKIMMPFANLNTINIDEKLHPKNLKFASVVCLIYKKDNQFYFLLMKRTASNFAHSKQISFPGGRIEANETEQNAALREFKEEIGIELSEQNILGKLTNIYIPVSNFKVFPYIAFLPVLPKLNLCKTEVEYVIEVKISDLLNEKLVKEKMMKAKYGKFNAKYFDFENEVVWGATAVILSELKTIVKTII